MQNDLDSIIFATTNGDLNALEQLFIELKGSVFAVAISILRDRTAAEDVVQQTFVNINCAKGKFKPCGQGKSWVLKIAKNISIRELRKRSKHVEFDDSFLNPNNIDIEEHAIDSMILSSALKMLTKTQRQVVLMHATGLTHNEISQVLNRPPSTIRWLYAEGIKKLTSLCR